ncbi:MAG: T9SS type A sorting domain-containing protein, partial [Bacteroidota bacterium]
IQKVVSPDREAADFYGFSVAISGDAIIVGAQTEDTDDNLADSTANAGAIYFLEPCSLDTMLINVAGGLEANLANASYQWFACGMENIPIPGDTNKIFLAMQSGEYGVLLSKDGCTIPTSCQTVMTTDIEPDALTNIQLSPNPVSHILQLTSSQAMNEVFISVHDTKGSIIWEATYDRWKTTEINVNNWMEGVYLIRVASPQAVWSKLFLKS